MPLYSPTGYDPADGPLNNMPNPINPPQQNAPLFPVNDDDGNPMPNIPTGDSNTGGMPDWLRQLLSGGGNTALGLSSLLPSLISGAHGLYNADKYGDVAKDAANRASPVDLATRQRYQGRLDQLYTDPTAFLEGNPEFMANKKLGTGALNARNASRGNIGDGRATQDELTFISDLGSRYINQERDDLMNMGGFQFDPANGANMLMKGNDQEIQARTAALAALAYPFGASQGPGRGPGSTTPGSTPGRPNSPAGTTAGIPNGLLQAFAKIPGGLQGLFGNDPSVVQSLASMGIVEQPDGTFNFPDVSTDPGFNPGYPTDIYGPPDPGSISVNPWAGNGTDPYAGTSGFPVEDNTSEWTSWSPEQWETYYGGWESNDFDFANWWGN